jgi:hypothetical protein
MTSRNARLARAVTALASLACASKAATDDAYQVAYPLVIERTSEESLAGKPSLVRETSFAHLTWSQGAAGATGRLRVDSVHFVRDGRHIDVGPESRPVATFVYRVGPDGKVALDSAPTQLVEHPYLATVILELPAMRPIVSVDRCRAGTTWTDSMSVGPVPVPGVEGAIAVYRSRFTVDGVAGDTVLLHVLTQVIMIGRSGDSIVMRGDESRDAMWRYAANCRGPATTSETGALSLIYEADHDTVSVVEKRSISSRRP